MRVLLDTNVMARAAAHGNSPARAVLLRLLDPPHVIVASSFLINELRRVLCYPRVQALHRLSEQEVDQFVRDIETNCEIIDVAMPPVFHVPNDPDDDPIVALAVYGRVDVVCTRDRHLRRPEVVAYCDQFNSRILSDVELLTELKAQDAGSP